MYPSILIVDDEIYILQSLSGLLTDDGFEVTVATNGYEALKIIEDEQPDLVLIDIWMPGIDGLTTLEEIKRIYPLLPVVVITGHGNVETAVKATKLGAYDLIEKPLSIDSVIITINNALNFRRLEEENRYLKKKIIEQHSISGNSKSVKNLKQQISVVAPTDSWVFIKGENGTGKELVARTIHQLSLRAERPFIEINCAVIPEHLIESELFGHEKGSFTGATSKKIGKFELAHGGTLFLDEIGDMSMITQAKILRVLQEKQFQRVGNTRIFKIDIRVIAATNKNLEYEIKNNRFRKDLYYRLNVVPVLVPPLRNRKDDIPLMINTFMEEAIARNKSKKKIVTLESIEILKNYKWPGNVRELKNLIERLAIMIQNDVIKVENIPFPYTLHNKEITKYNLDSFLNFESLEEATMAFKVEFVRRIMKKNGNKIDITAKSIGVKTRYVKSLLHGKK
jgi:two-component system nitrogen regulation response regulator NtrX